MNLRLVKHSLLVVGAGLALTACAALPGKRPDSQASRDLAALLTGVYNNHAQIWQRQQQGLAAPASVRVVIEPIAGRAGVWLQFSEYREGADGALPTRQVRWALRPGGEPGIIVQSVYRRKQEAWEALDGCRVYWRQSDSGFAGQTRGAGCRFRGASPGKVVTIQRGLTVSPAGVSYRQSVSGEGAASVEVVQLARLVTYSGWAGVRPKRDESAVWRLDEGIRVHNQGGSIALVDDAGNALGYRIKLEQLVWPKSNIPMLRLSVWKDSTNEMRAYVWAAPDASRIGMNLGWLQVGLERGR